ncbi:DUF3304 domain-containing protein [Stenotrophomonas maltophilia]|uniref:DUF3304 domain-containing protein n=1 Tax=Stenotrophomonas maltophilia TaxID=40324 RepID=UPI0020971BC9|nr:DUF3304 domain-containing protein [Stenotrophomonas maltophilia]MCO7397182.1 DUF3304 domain-containing protein [Stenotrophomonas maltophilia]MCO7410626.1 DUF3304 domain-containing protein [Stenotrophomonas maltophilia]
MSKLDIDRPRQRCTGRLLAMRRQLRPVAIPALPLLVAAVLCACARADKAYEPSAYIGSNLTSMDYEPTDTFVRPVYVNGKGGGRASTGASTALGVLSLPTRWYPGLTVRVKWRRCEAGTEYVPDEPVDEGCRWVEKDVPVQPYTHVAETWLHIFENDEVLVIPSVLFPSDPDYPGARYPYKNFFDKRGIGEHE